MPPGISLSTSGQTTAAGTTTESTTTTPSPTTLPPNFCRTSADCPLSSCCRDLNQKVLVMSEVFDATGKNSLLEYMYIFAKNMILETE